MKVSFRSSFERDIRRLHESKIRIQVRACIESVEIALNPGEIQDLKKLRGTENYYRIRLGDYRIGLAIEGDQVIFIRCLHRRDIYRYFP